MALARTASTFMTKPNIYEPYAFDANQDYRFTFSYSGSQAMKNKLVIRDNATWEIIYENTIETMQLAHTVPAGSLVNGVLYNAVVTVYDGTGEDANSITSSEVLFYCYTQPTMTITNLPALTIVKNSSYEISFTYEQPEGEPLNSYQVILYNSLGDIISRSGNKYSNGETSFTYLISSLDDNTEYSVQVLGETLNHMVADTGKIVFSAEYINPSVFAVIDLTNIEREGQIKIQSNIVSIIGHSIPDPPIYIDGKEVDSRGDGHCIWFDEGFNIDGDFLMQLVMRDPNEYSVIMTFNQDQIAHIELKYMLGTFGIVEYDSSGKPLMPYSETSSSHKGYFVLRAYNALTNYVIYSNYIDIPAETDYIHVWVKKVKDVYELIAEVLRSDDE